MNSIRPAAPPSRILLVDDDSDIHDLVAGLLGRQSVELLTACDGERALDVAIRESPDLILLDYEMPGASGLEVLSQLRSAGVPSSTAIVMVTGNDSHKVLTACFQAGAADYIRKPFCASEFRARVRSWLDRKQMLQQLERLAHHDALTGLFNRASIHALIQEAIDHAQSRHYALLFLDFDRFKMVNDTLGHDAGDQLLRMIAERLRRGLRGGDGIAFAIGGDTAARLGGDEFVVLLKDLAQPIDALIVAERLLEALAQPYTLAGRQIRSTASIGVATSAKAYATPTEILRDADAAMYAAKLAGKGCYVLFNESMHASGSQSRAIENAQCSVTGSRRWQGNESSKGFKSGLRWQQPIRGSIMPPDFIPIAQ